MSLGIGPQALTWLGHRPLFALKQATGCRQLADTCPVQCPGSELIEMAFLKVGDLQRWEVRLRKLRLGRGRRPRAVGQPEQETLGTSNTAGYSRGYEVAEPGAPQGAPTMLFAPRTAVVVELQSHSSLTLHTRLGMGWWLTGCQSGSSESCWSKK